MPSRTMGAGTTNEETRMNWVKQRLCEIPAGSRILDAGAGEQRFRPLCSHLDYVAQDFAAYDGIGDGKGLQTGAWDRRNLDIICDITSIPEEDASFDAVLCVEVFEHLPNPFLALKEFSRLLRRGGHLILTAPFCSLNHFAPYHFYTGFDRYFYETFLPRYHFEILQLKGNGNFFEYIAQEIRRIGWVANRYTNDRPRLGERWALKGILRMLGRFSQKDRGSSELLNFGFLVWAIRN